MSTLKARKIGNGHIGKWVSLYRKIQGTELEYVAGGHGKLVNYCQKGLEVSFIIGGSFEPVTIGQNDIVEIIEYLDEDGWVTC